MAQLNRSLGIVETLVNESLGVNQTVLDRINREISMQFKTVGGNLSADLASISGFLQNKMMILLTGVQDKSVAQATDTSLQIHRQTTDSFVTTMIAAFNSIRLFS